MLPHTERRVLHRLMQLFDLSTPPHNRDSRSHSRARLWNWRIVASTAVIHGRFPEGVPHPELTTRRVMTRVEGPLEVDARDARGREPCQLRKSTGLASP